MPGHRLERGTPLQSPLVAYHPDFRRLVALANAGRRNLSQTVRLLLDAALRAAQAV